MSTEMRRGAQILKARLTSSFYARSNPWVHSTPTPFAARLEQLSEQTIRLNQGTLYPALVRLEQNGWIKGTWGKTEKNREAKFYSITKSGVKAMGEEAERWRSMSTLMEKLLCDS